MTPHKFKPFLKFPNPLKLILVFTTGLFVGLLVSRFYNKSPETPVIEHREGQYEFINPLLECEGSEEMISKELSPFRERLEELIQKKINEKKIHSAAVYFRDLNNGPWIGINEKEAFLPGSLLKIPIMMGYLKKAEKDPDILIRTIEFKEAATISGQFIRPAVLLEKGKSYTVEELIRRMIIYSDNEAARLLRSADEEDLYHEVYKDLGLEVPAGGGYKISVKKYASFFRMLFNASYLNKEMSNIALKILSNSDFNEGLVAGVPPDVPVAQKFGESKSEDNQRQLHNCGIVFYPKHPYLLCVMTRGDDYRNLTPVIRDVSRLTFEEVDSQMRSYQIK